MERRMLLAVVLSFLVVTLYSAATGRCTPPPKDPEPKEAGPEGATPGQPAAPEQPGTPGTMDPASPEAPPPTQPAPPAPPAEAGPQKDHQPAQTRFVVETPELEVAFTTRGGAIEWIRLRNAYDIDRKTPLDLIVPIDEHLLLGQVDDTFTKPKSTEVPGPADREEFPAGPMRRWHWTHDAAAEAATPEADVVFTFTTADGTVWTKRWILPEDARRFDVRLRLSRRMPAGAPADSREMKVLVSSGLLREPSTGASYQYPNQALMRLAKMSEAHPGVHGLDLPDADVNPADLRLLGARTHYFLTGCFLAADSPAAKSTVRWWATGEAQDLRQDLVAQVGAYFRDERGRDPQGDANLRERIQDGIANLHLAWLVLDVPNAEELEIPLYVGPIDRHVLRQDVYAVVKPVIQYPAAPDILADALLAIYDLFRSLLGNAGIAVILMTLVVRGLMMPISIRNQLSMRQYSRKIAKVKPKLDAMKKKYGNNVKKLREEQAKLYREHGIGFPTGCLMLVIQLPIFFALFSSLRSEYTLRNSAFLWISDLSGPDKMIDFGSTIFDIGILTIFSINILPLLMVGLSIWQQRLMPKPADEQQAQQMRMMKWLPIVFAVILYNYTAALSLYMVLSSVMAILESRIVRHKDKDASGEPAEGGAWPGAAGMPM